MTSQTIAMTLSAGILILVLIERVFRMFKPAISPLDNPVIFLALVFGSMLVLRWPEISWPQGINLDEAQMLAQAMRFCVHHVPWRDVDGTTSGPINSLFLAVPIYFGAPPTWQTARIALWAANCLTILFLYLALRCFGTRAETQFVLLPAIFFYGFALGPDFTHYSSETVPVLFVSAGLCLLCRQWCAVRPSKLELFSLGLAAGGLPFTKLQAAPLALFLATVGLMQILTGNSRVRSEGKGRWTNIAALCLGAAAPTLLILGWVTLRGAISDFWISYVLASGAYAQEVSPAARMENVWSLFAAWSDFRSYLFCAMAAAAITPVAFYARRQKPLGNLVWPFAAAVVLVIVTVCVFVAAGKAFLHYTLLLVPALAVFTGLAFFVVQDRFASGADATSQVPCRRAPWLIPAFLIAMTPLFFQPIRYLRDVQDVYPRAASSQVSVIAARIRTAAKPGDTMAIWGWMPSYYVESGLTPATRDAIGHYVITRGPYRDYFRKRFLADLEQSRPPIFMDAVCDGAYLWWNWKRSDAHEGFPGLSAFIDQNYDLWWTIHLTGNGVPLRIYLLKSRSAEFHLRPGNVETFPDLTAEVQSY